MKYPEISQAMQASGRNSFSDKSIGGGLTLVSSTLLNDNTILLCLYSTL